MAEVDIELVTRICRAATAAATGGRGALIGAERDPLDSSVWVRLTSWPRAQEASAQLMTCGLRVIEREDGRLQVAGWDARLLRRRLGTVLAGIDDLRQEWDATAELARFHYDRRAASGQEPDPAEVLGDVERTMRDALPIPHRSPGTDDVDSLLALIEAAEDAYAQLIGEHVEYAAAILEHDARVRTAAGTHHHSVRH